MRSQKRLRRRFAGGWSNATVGAQRCFACRTTSFVPRPEEPSDISHTLHRGEPLNQPVHPHADPVGHKSRGRPQMKPFIVIPAAVVIVTILVAAQSKQPVETEATVKKEILRIENERNRAVVSGDAAVLDRLTAADYTFITLRGEVRTKDEIVKGFRS